LTIAPLFVVCAAMAAAIIPRGEQAFLHQLRLVAAPLDLISIALVGRKLLELRRSAAAVAEDVEARIRVAAQSIFGNGFVAGAVASEVSIVYYALFAWRKKPVVPLAARAVTVHEQSGWGSIVAGLLVVIAAESIGMHLLLQRWSATAAWIATALDAYGMLWLIGDYHALRLRPTLITRESIEIRHGLRWSATIDRANIAAIATVQREEDWKRRRTLKVALIDEPRFIIRLHHPVTATGIAGMRKTIDSIAIRPDDADSFIAVTDADSR
jgi:hypothetical protein